jgi:hypothetical protein
MRFVSFAPLLALLLALAGCNSNRQQPPIEAVQPPAAQDVVRVTPRAAPEGCAEEIARYRAIQDNDLAMGHVDKGVYAQIQTEISEAEHACSAGDGLRAQYLLRASKERHGYPAG